MAAVAAYSPGSGNFQNLLGALRTGGLITYPSAGRVRLASGTHVAAISRTEAHARLMSILSGSQRRVLEAMKGHPVDYPKREEIASRAGYSVASGNFQNILGSLRTLDIITYPVAGRAALTDWAKELMRHG